MLSKYRIKLKIYRAFAKHPKISWLSLKMSNFLYTAFLVNYLLKAYPLLSFETVAGIALGFPLYALVSNRIDKLFGR